MINQIVSYWCDKSIIAEEDKELYAFGLKQGALVLLNIVTTLIIGVLLGMIVETLLFLFSYMSLRTYTGGYHAETAFTCYVVSSAIIVIALFIIGNVEYSLTSMLALFLINSLCIFFFAPQASKNKPLDNEERRNYRKKVIMRFLLHGIILFISLFMDFKVIATVVSTSMGCVSVLLVIGLLKTAK